MVFLIFVACLFLGGGAAAALPAGPLAAPADASGTAPAAVSDDAVPVAALLRDVPRDLLPMQAQGLAAPFGPTAVPTPDALAGYDRLDDASARAAWAAWVEAAAWQMHQGADPMGFQARAAAPPDPAVPPVALADAPARGLSGIWSLDEHGHPSALHAAGENGAHFLVTSEGVIRFPSANGSAEWMVKPGGYIGHTETTDVDGDGVLDIVIGLFSWWVTEDPSIVVVGGADGAILWSGLAGRDSLYQWTLTDVDGDGSSDIIGLDASNRMVAYALDGTAHYQMAVPDLGDLPAGGFLLFYFGLQHANMGHLFADVDGDGTQDFIIASSLGAYLGVLITGLGADIPMLSAYSGRDTSLVWQVPTGLELSNGYSRPIASGDLDGDGKDDVLLVETTLQYVPGIVQMETQYKVVSGDNGLLLARDAGGRAYACAVTCVVQEYGVSYWPLALADVDGDGRAELVTEEVVNRPFGLSIVGRGAPAVQGGPFTELYREAVKMDAAYDWADGYATLRDADGDGDPEVLVVLFTEARDDEGQLEDVAVHRFFVDEAGAKGGRMADLFGFYDVLPGGIDFGWDVRTDRWGTVSDEGAREGDGFRLVLSTYPLVIVDRNGDKVPDLMLRKTIGYLWIDGRNGRLLQDVERPLTSYAVGVYEEGGRQMLLEQEWENDLYRLVDAVTLAEAWSVPNDIGGEAGWMRGLSDITGDGTLDLLFETWGHFVIFGPSSPLGGPGYVEERERRFWAVDARSEETVFETTLTNGGTVWVADALTERRGEELLQRARDGEANMLRLFVPGEDEPRWSYNLGDGWMRTARDGYILVSVRQESEVFEILVGSSGELVASYPLPADGRSSQTFFTRVDGDRFPELVTSFLVEDVDTTEQEMLIYDWANEAEVARYPLEKGKVETRYHAELDFEYTFERTSYVTEEVGDWDNDGLVDFAYREAERAVVRSTGSGEVLAVAPGIGQFIRAHDMNGAGPKEVLMMTEEGRLRLFSYAPRVEMMDEPTTKGIRTITAVDESETHDAADRFFDGIEDEGLPAPGFGLAVAFLALAVFVARRRANKD